MQGRVLVLTGTIASGKSTAARIFVSLGAYLISLDEITHELLVTDEDLINEIAATFGTRVLAQDGSVDRQQLAARVFSDDEARLKLESIMHPKIIRVARTRIAANTGRVIVLEVPLLDRAEEFAARADEIIWVRTSEDKARVRALQRGLTQSKYQRRRDAQPEEEYLARHATIVIENDGNIDELKEKIQELNLI